MGVANHISGMASATPGPLLRMPETWSLQGTYFENGLNIEVGKWPS